MRGSPRTGDHVFGARGGVFAVTRVEAERVIVKDAVKGLHGRRAIRLHDLECVDWDDGIWQEIQERSNA